MERIVGSFQSSGRVSARYLPVVFIGFSLASDQPGPIYMANNCYNLIEFLGNKKVKAQARAWNAELAKFAPTPEDPHCLRAIRAVFYPDLDEGTNLDFGSKWVHVDTESLSPSDDQLGLQSAWGRPALLEQHLACLLYRLDKKVVIRNSYNIEDGSRGVAYTTPESETGAYCQWAYEELDSHRFDDPEEAELDLESRLAKSEVQILTDYFLDDMPHLAKVLRKHLPHLEIDWEEFD